MRQPIFAALTPLMLVLAAAGVSACNRAEKAPAPVAAPAPAPAPVAPPPAALPTPLPPPVADGQPTFPVAGTPYAQARAALIGQGMAPYSFTASAPGHPECSRKLKQCVFTWTDKTGFASYLIVVTDPTAGAVQSIGFATQEEERALNLAPLNLPPTPLEDLPPAVNPYARDSGRAGWTTQRLPGLAGAYLSARDKLVAAGFGPVPGKAPTCRPPKPVPAPTPGAASALSPSAVLPPLAPAAPVICRPPRAPPEIHGCAMAGLPACQAVWSRDNQTLVVNTLGDPAPGDVDNMYWATPAEAADFRAGRK
jgi:hypothetical protein